MVSYFVLTNAIYLGLILIVALFSLAIGFRRGITGQISSLLGFAFGAVAARVLTPQFVDGFRWTTGISHNEDLSDFTAHLICASVIYFVVYFLFTLLGPVLRAAMSVFETGIFNRILGSVFCMIKNMLWLSIALNIYLCVTPRIELIEYERANDGNLVAAVMDMTQEILGCSGAEEFVHYHQLREAKKIS